MVSPTVATTLNNVRATVFQLSYVINLPLQFHSFEMAALTDPDFLLSVSFYLGLVLTGVVSFSPSSLLIPSTLHPSVTPVLQLFFSLVLRAHRFHFRIGTRSTCKTEPVVSWKLKSELPFLTDGCLPLIKII